MNVVSYQTAVIHFTDNAFVAIGSQQLGHGMPTIKKKDHDMPRAKNYIPRLHNAKHVLLLPTCFYHNPSWDFPSDMLLSPPPMFATGCETE